MVAFERPCAPRSKVFTHVIEQYRLVILNVGLRVVPLVVWRDITCPEKSVWRKLVDLLAHFLEDRHWNVANARATVGSSCILRIIGHSAFQSTTQEIQAVCLRAYHIVQVQMQISELYNRYSFAS